MCRYKPIVSHIFFVDNNLIFLKANMNDCNNFKHISREYEMALGQMINFEKSSIFFSPNCAGSLRNNIISTVEANIFQAQRVF